MGRIWMPGGEGSGADLDVTTAAAGDILKGKVIVGPDGEPLTGVLELTGTVADSQVLSEQTYYNTDAKIKRTGTMANQGAKTASLNCGDSYTIPAGYHNGGGKVTANSLASQTGVQSGKTAAGAAQILSGYEGWVNGGRVTGAMANQGAKTESLNCGGSYTIFYFWGPELYTAAGQILMPYPPSVDNFPVLSLLPAPGPPPVCAPGRICPRPAGFFRFLSTVRMPVPLPAPVRHFLLFLV